MMINKKLATGHNLANTSTREPFQARSKIKIDSVDVEGWLEYFCFLIVTDIYSDFRVTLARFVKTNYEGIFNVMTLLAALWCFCSKIDIFNKQFTFSTLQILSEV